MTHQDNNSVLQEILEKMTNVGLDSSDQALSFLLNAAMVLERQRHINAQPYERSEERQGQSNGFKSKTVQSRVGALNLSVPQVRDSSFYPESLEKGIRSEKALRLALAEMYIQGVSTRKIKVITEQLCGFDISSSQVSKVTKELDILLDAWRNRLLGSFKYIYLDARYENVRQGGVVLSCAVLLAIGVDQMGRREVLGASVSLSEAEVHWRSFLTGLQNRGLHGITLFISDDHPGLKAARQSVFPSVAWQRCQVHIQRNASSHVPKKDMKESVAAAIRAIFNAPNKDEASRLLNISVAAYEKTAPDLASWMEANIPEGLTVFSFPEHHRIKLRTSNVIERLNREIKRRTRVANLFPNEASCLRLVTAIVMETSDDWLSDRSCYLPTDRSLR